MKNLKKHNLTFISLNIFIILLMLLPKDIPNILGIIPVRTSLTYLLFFIFIYDKFKNKIEINNINFKWFGITYGLFLLFTIPSIITTKSIITTIYTIIKFISFILFLYVCIKLKLTKEEYKLIIKNILILSLLKFIWGLIEYIFGINLFTVGAYKYPGAKGRVKAFFFNTIYYGIYINIIFSYVYYLFNLENKKQYKALLGIILILGFINIILTFTRSTFLVFGGILVLLLVFLNKRIISRYTIGIMLISLGIAVVIPGSNIFMLSSINDIVGVVFENNPLDKLLPKDKVHQEEDAEMGDYSLAHRKLFAKTGIEIGKDNMFTGIGFGSYIDYINTDEFKEKYPKYSNVHTHPHSSYVLMFSEIGILAVISFTLFMLSIFITLIKELKNNKLKKDVIIITLCITTGFYIVNIIAENAFYDTQIFPIYLLVLGLSLSYINSNEKLIKE